MDPDNDPKYIPVVRVVGDPSSCRSDRDCNLGTCVQGKCKCKPSSIGSRCQYPNPCINSPCKNDGKCIPVEDDGSFYCDCKLGFIDPTCSNQDPCILKGNAMCMNGSTCRRKELEFVCECLYPYTGTYCETYDLCLLDVDECVPYLNVESESDPICSPCVDQATCIQISTREHVCICNSNVHDPSCYTKNIVERNQTSPSKIVAQSPKLVNHWNAIIPSIALTTCALYIILFVLVLIFLRKLRKRRPRLIVCCDLDKYEEQAYYLVNVHTGGRFKAGTKANVYCILLGEHGQAGPFPLNDSNLRAVHVLERDQEDNYLVSSPTEMGEIDKVVLYLEDEFRENNKTWFCQRITVQNIKTNEYWNFDVCGWVLANRFQKRHADTVEQFLKRERVRMNFRHFWYHMSRNHVYIAPFCRPTKVRVTLAFAELMTYMFFLIVFYGFVTTDKIYGFYIYTVEVWKVGSIVGVIGFALGIIYALLFSFVNSDRIPTLVIWKGEEPIQVPKKPVEILPGKTFRDVATNTDPEPPPVPVPRKRRSIPLNDSVFRIPSTDIVLTEAWVSTVTDAENISRTRLVHDYTSTHNTLKLSDKIMKYGFVGSLQDNRQQDPTFFIYQTQSVRALESAIQKDIREAYQNLTWGPSQDSIGEVMDELSSNVVSPDPSTMSMSKVPLVSPEESTIIAVAEESTQDLASGDFHREEKEKTENSLYVREGESHSWELCEMGNYKHKILTKCSAILGWMLCIGMVITATVISCIYGGKYGDVRTYNWCISLVIAWFENFLLYQMLKVVGLMLLCTILVEKKKIPTYEAKKIHERFQVHQVPEGEDRTKLPDNYPLKYVNYLPKNWKPIPDRVNLSNETEVPIKHYDDNDTAYN